MITCPRNGCDEDLTEQVRAACLDEQDLPVHIEGEAGPEVIVSHVAADGEEHVGKFPCSLVTPTSER